MQFCKDCGSVLNLFGNSDRELCSSCIQQKKIHAPAQLPATKDTSEDSGFRILENTVFYCQGNRMILLSKEGWELWSGPANTQVPLKTILDRAMKIYQMRLRRQKN
jgi:hypothetical protein